MESSDLPPTPTGRITAITPTQRDPRRAVVKVNGRAAATLPVKVIGDLGLAVGQPWGSADAARVSDAAAFDKALRGAARRLDRRPMSRRRLDDKLRQLGHDAPLRRRVLERLEQLRLLDDETLARRLLEEWQARKAAGPALLRAKLYQRGFERGVVDKLLAEEAADASRDRVGEAAALASRKVRSLRGLDPAVAKRRLWEALARRGFDYETIEAALRRVQAEEVDDSASA